MYVTKIYGLEVRMQGSVFALFIYRDEFGTDFLQDYQKSIADGYISPTFLLQAAWAMARGFDSSVPQFTVWLSQMDEELFSLTNAQAITGWIEEVFSAILAEMFCKKPTLSTKAKQRIRRVGSSLKRRNSKADGVHAG